MKNEFILSLICKFEKWRFRMIDYDGLRWVSWTGRISRAFLEVSPIAELRPPSHENYTYTLYRKASAEIKGIRVLHSEVISNQSTLYATPAGKVIELMLSVDNAADENEKPKSHKELSEDEASVIIQKRKLCFLN